MRYEKLRKHKRHDRWLEGLFSRNPVLVCGLALPFAVMITNTLKTSAAVSVLLACSLIPTVLLSALIGKYLPAWVSPIVYTLFSAVLVIAATPLVSFISPEVLNALGIYIPIISINTVTLTLCARAGRDGAQPSLVAADAFSYSVGFALAMAAIGSVRELLGNNTIWGLPVTMPVKLDGVQVAFAGFIVTAFLAALFRFIRRCVLCLYYRHYSKTEEPAAL